MTRTYSEVARVHGSGPRMQRQRYGDKGTGARALGKGHCCKSNGKCIKINNARGKGRGTRTTW